MADFENAINVIFEQEGFLSDDCDDPGGLTKYGISLRFLESLGEKGDINKDGLINRDDVLALDIPTAKKLYLSEFWDFNSLSLINNQLIAGLIFSMSVNSGNYQCGLIAQRTVNRISMHNKVLVDGNIGPKTVEGINDCGNVIAFVDSFVVQFVNFYRCIANKKESQRKNLRGWINRVYDFVD